MRLPFPERIPLKIAAIYAAILFVLEQMQGTETYYSICVFSFIVIATLTFNMAGGFTRPTGGYVFAYAMLGCILGWTWKAWLGEAADTNLRSPHVTVGVFLGGIVSMFVAVYFSTKLRPRKALLEGLLPERHTSAVVAICVVFGMAITLLTYIVPHTDGSLISSLQQANNWIPLAIILGVRHEIERSGGQRSVNAPVLIAGGFYFVFGLINFSKEGIFTPFLCYLVAACSMRLRVSLGQIAGAAVVVYLMATYLTPYSQYGRGFKSLETNVSLSQFEYNAGQAVTLLSDLGRVRQQNEAIEQFSRQFESTSYFNSNQGLIERLQMISADDLLIDATERGKSSYGLLPIWTTLAGAIPHIFWPNRPEFYWGNLYAHEIGGMIDDRDATTGVSFTPSSEAYHMAGWLGVFLVAPAVWLFDFLFCDLVCGDVRRSPWGLFIILLFAHVAPEGMLTGSMMVVERNGPALIGAAYLCAYAIPFLVSLFLRARSGAAPAVRATPQEG
ncbi:hypothetical protein SAMN05421770_106155 [Granulicella rosea]|uniref:Oligosaccharide repeat unit polymerase n=1 Tax=Granulicella rosea TaxID=474952 RepID=A0A239L868_9BACT|nr:hypothetical protein [Granulicella rosea]SNT26182.1 hypothetical protein SAMN05421770_106155 [Granulicella rosea]